MRSVALKPKNFAGIMCAVLAAALYALNAPISKLLLTHISAAMLAAFLYLGAGIGMFCVGLVQRFAGKHSAEEPLSKSDLPYIVGMILLDIAAPILLMIGLSDTTAANASLLNNFEIVATSVIALCIFHEKISARLWTAIILVTAACAILSFEGSTSLSFSPGSLLVLLACICWGFENNCTRKLSAKDPLRIVVIKGIGSGLGSLGIAFAVGESLPAAKYLLGALLLGFVAYGLSIFFYIRAQRTLGAAKTSTFYAIAPFIGTAISLVVFRQSPSLAFWIGTVIMIGGTAMASLDELKN